MKSDYGGVPWKQMFRWNLGVYLFGNPWDIQKNQLG